MATIKSYTDIEQSHKLAEILPLESADMYYPNRTDVKYQGALPIEFKYGNPLLSQEIAAWSLAALLDILPKIHNLRPILDLEENSIQYSGIDLYITAGSPIDACYELILKLHKRKLL